MEQLLADLFGLLLILSGSLWGMAAGSWLNNGVGGLLGLVVGALWGFHMAEGCTLLLKTQKERNSEAYEKGLTTVLAQSENAPLAGSKRPWLSRILGRKSTKSPLPETHDLYSLEEIHRRLKAINADVWRELRLFHGLAQRKTVSHELWFFPVWRTGVEYLRISGTPTTDIYQSSPD